ncbi:MAG: response regulator transcription factor [Candidatus Puniceispirillaceae bacterium]|jgi:two-component system OmpR family response regulator|nr:response regulator transcription factor [Candidatus Puniceispirillum sp.]
MRLLIIEDNQALATALLHRFSDDGHAVTVVHDGYEGLQFFLQEDFDLCILDVNLPGMSGFEILANAKSKKIDTPVLMLTARDTTADRVVGLDAGADDYLIKPFEMEELEARVRALLRRQPTKVASITDVGMLQLRHDGRVVLVEGRDLRLPRKEFAVFECLSSRMGQLVEKTTLLEHVYGIGADASDTAIEVLVSRLRKKITPYGVEIKMARGLGYYLKVTE